MHCSSHSTHQVARAHALNSLQWMKSSTPNHLGQQISVSPDCLRSDHAACVVSDPISCSESTNRLQPDVRGMRKNSQRATVGGGEGRRLPMDSFCGGCYPGRKVLDPKVLVFIKQYRWKVNTAKQNFNPNSKHRSSCKDKLLGVKVVSNSRFVRPKSSSVYQAR